MSIRQPLDRRFDIRDMFQLFLRCVGVKDCQERILIFGDLLSTPVFEGFSFWFSNGTFKLSPKNICEIYTL